MADFTRWLLQQTATEGPIGDLATDASKDERWPMVEWLPFAAFHHYLERHGDHIVEALREAWEAWVTETRVLGVADRFVYFIQSEGSKRVKIGIAKDPVGRVQELQTGSPERLKLLVAVPGGRAQEMALHSAFATTSVNGEWFEWSRELSAQIAYCRISYSPDPFFAEGTADPKIWDRMALVEKLRWAALRAEREVRTSCADAMPLYELRMVAQELIDLIAGNSGDGEGSE